ncbi:MAG: hypothetical protein AAGA72_00080 [Pseudomonadota bacterium]
MGQTSLDQFIGSVRQSWTGLNSNTVEATLRALQALSKSPNDEPWLSDIHREKPATRELYRDPDHGFILLVHSEHRDQYRKPHDHGEGWVFYAVQYGESQMTTYKPVTSQTGVTSLVSRGAVSMTKGDCQVFLPRDIHDTACISDYLIQFRLTSTDFSREKVEGRMIQYQTNDAA